MGKMVFLMRLFIVNFNLLAKLIIIKDLSLILIFISNHHFLLLFNFKKVYAN